MAESYFCTPNLVLYNQAKVAHLVEHDLAKVGVASSSLVFRSKSRSSDGIFFKSVTDALVVELVDTQDLKSCSPQRECGFDSRLGHYPFAYARGFFLLYCAY